MKRDSSKGIARDRATAEGKDGTAAPTAPSPAGTEKSEPPAGPRSEADSPKEWDDEAWRPHRATYYWQADLADFGLDDSRPDSAGPASEKTDD